MCEELKDVRIGIAVCGSFCTFQKVFETAERLKAHGAELIPIMSFNAFSISTRFGEAEKNVKILEEIAGRKVINSINGAEPIGPKNMTDIMLLPNCTGNTLAKLAMSVTDTAVVHLRKQRPVCLISKYPRCAGVEKRQVQSFS